MFIGREQELALLNQFKQRSIAGLGVIYGRRRIGKSTLIEHFAKDSHFLELYGLPPDQASSNAKQLAHFSQLLAATLGISPMQFNNWFEAFSSLAALTQTGPYIILLDEISWMAAFDTDFPGILKGIWDTKFKKNNQLILMLCGSVSSWIEKNILQNRGYVGRVSLQLKLEELPLNDVNKFWRDNAYISAYEKFKLLSVTGGVPRYVEEINPKLTAEENIKNLCYLPNGLLFNEFDTIFNDVFGKNDKKYRQIVSALVNGNCEQSELSRKLQIPQSGAFSEQLNALESAGFIQRDFCWDIKKNAKTSSKYRLKDNYLRFYLKYIEPHYDLIKKNIYQFAHLENLQNWQTIMGLQFENLVLNNLQSIIKKLNIAPETILSASPYFQSQTSRQQATQIDLLIHTSYTIYICEIKFRKKISTSVIKEVSDKIIKLKLPQHLSIRPVLIYQGQLSESVVRANYFSSLIEFSDLLK